MQLWDRGYWEPDDPERGFKKGDLKFTLDGDKLHGSWVLVRMKDDRNGGKRTNWLLIKHRDEFAKEGEANDILDRGSIGRLGPVMEQIAAGKGRAPKPFMLAKTAARPADAVWHSNRGDAGRSARARPGAPSGRRQHGEGREAGRSRRRSRRCRISSRRSSALRSSGRRAGTAGATRSSSTATACSCASRMAKPR